MNKSELTSAIAAKTGLSKKNSEAALNAFITTVSEALKAGEKVVLVGFGTFDVRDRKERDGINPATKEKIRIPASKAPAFKAGKVLKEYINN